jgi:DNA-binding transcriptional ArsR family regulator
VVGTRDAVLRVRKHHATTETIRDATRVSAARARDPVGLELVRRAWGNPESTCSALADGLDVPMSTLSNHWRILREAGLISMIVDGRHRRIRPRADDLRDRFPGLLDPILRLGTAESLNSGLL